MRGGRGVRVLIVDGDDEDRSVEGKRDVVVDDLIGWMKVSSWSSWWLCPRAGNVACLR